jgi:hypothetical protein
LQPNQTHHMRRTWKLMERTRHSGFQGFAGDFQRATTATQRYASERGPTSRTDSHANPTVPIDIPQYTHSRHSRWNHTQYGPGISVCPKVPVTAVKIQTWCNVACQLAEGRRQNHTQSITFRGPAEEEEKTRPCEQSHRKRKPVRKSPCRVGTRGGRQGGQKQKEGSSPARHDDG